ncbi:MarR family transcriptional regulator [Kribbella turkmenica]|uniref:MarR family transcriptional regulator n=1 Tax=Kribbella turkmenica TaxID=2530375 RepID=A0A4R4WYS0_9ACTN|nr:MarR family transcriptional regulator [Kribbella turkmenica]TDD23043.1 MarR family transcriptional regulator [Kribbella turkmenica]
MEETGQPPISPALLLMMLGRQLRDRTDAELRRQGLSMRHFSALGHLAHQPGLSYSELARRDGITAQSMQSTLLQLQDMGAVERRSAPGRGRTADLQVTAAGQELLDRCRAVLNEVDGRLRDAVGPDQAALMAEATLDALTAFSESS